MARKYLILNPITKKDFPTAMAEKSFFFFVAKEGDLLTSALHFIVT